MGRQRDMPWTCGLRGVVSNNRYAHMSDEGITKSEWRGHVSYHQNEANNRELSENVREWHERRLRKGNCRVGDPDEQHPPTISRYTGDRLPRSTTRASRRSAAESYSRPGAPSDYERPAYGSRESRPAGSRKRSGMTQEDVTRRAQMLEGYEHCPDKIQEEILKMMARESSSYSATSRYNRAYGGAPSYQYPPPKNHPASRRSRY